MGTMILAAPKSGGSPAFTFIILAVLIGLFYVLIMRPQRNRQRKAMQTQSQVMPGQRIRTTAGMYGTVVSGDDRDVVIEIAPGVEVTYAAPGCDGGHPGRHHAVTRGHRS